MFNFYRWYPTGKIVFMAPTRPLVKQQMDACYDIMGIPKENTAELIGSNMSASRENLWNEKRVFFITPQILQNDLDKIVTLSSSIKCLVFDEAHKARGNHAYCEVIRKMCGTNKYFRVLALSATPGSHVEDVLEVVQNLMISHLEFRTEESLDVNKYVFKRNLTTVVVPLGDKLQEVVNEYLKILEINTRTLMKYKVFQGSCGSLTKGKIFMTMKQYQQNRSSGNANYGEIMKCFNICMTLYHAWELLVRHGLRSFTSFFDEHIDKPTLRHNMRLIQLMQHVKEYLGPPPVVEDLPDGESIEISKDVKFGHPKFYKLRDILLTHFGESSSSRVIVFFEYRESVMEAYALLRQSGPIIRPRIFIGQKSGITQRIQTSVVKAFREGHCNTLLSTSIGEEGLDVGEVDLIICFDISNKSPIRMVQRMGRTGRKKEGSIIVLVTEGKEQQTLKDCLIHKNNVTSHVMGSRELARGLSSTSPRLIPEDLTPKCEKIFITVTKEPLPKKNVTLKDMFRKISSGGSEPSYSPSLQIIEIEERISKSEFLLDNGISKGPEMSLVCKQIQKQRSFQDSHIVKHSKETELLVNLLQLADSKKFNIPMSQIGNSQSQKNLKQTDIRNMFFKSDSCNDFVLPSTQVLQKASSPTPEEKTTFGSRELFNELLNFLTIQSLEYDQQCKLCPTNNCVELYTNPSKTDTTEALNWIELDDSVFTSLTLEDLKTYGKNMDKAEPDFTFNETMNFALDETPQLKTEDEILDANGIDSSILGELVDKSFGFQAPNTLDALLNKFSNTIVEVEQSQKTNLSVPETRESVLSFFKIEKLTDLFGNSNISDSQETLLYSPEIFDVSTPPPMKPPVSNNDSGSPILCTFNRNLTLRKKEQTQRKLFLSEDKNMATSSTPFQKNCDPATNIADDIELSSFCDLSYLGFKASPKKTAVTSTQVGRDESKLDSLDKFADLLDDSEFEWLKSSVKDKKNSVSKRFDNDEKTCNINPQVQPRTQVDDNINNEALKHGKEKSMTEVMKNNSSRSKAGDRPKKKVTHPSSESPVEEKEDLISSKFETAKEEPITISDDEEEIEPTTDLVKRATDIQKLDDSNIKSFENKEKMITSKSKDNKKGVETSIKVDACKELDDFEWVKPKAVEKDTVSTNTNNDTLDVLDVSDIFDTSDFILTNDRRSKNVTQYDTSQATVTQLLSLINKPGGAKSVDESSQKENINTEKIQENIEGKNTSHILSLVNVNSPNRDRFATSPDLVKKYVSNKNVKSKANLYAIDSQDDFEVFELKRSDLKKVSRESSVHNSRISPKSACTTSLDLHLSDSDQLEPNLDESIRNLSHSMLAQLVDSDEEFETKPPDTGWIRAKGRSEKRKEVSPKMNVGKKMRKDVSKPPVRKKTKRRNEFIEDEAQLSEDSNYAISDDERDGLSQDCYDESFVAHETIHNDTQMHAKYLQSVRSVNRGRFKMPNKPPPFRGDIFSQTVVQDDTYADLDDSFVVEGDEVEEIEELSQLEILERQLEMQRKARKKSKAETKPIKRRRVISSSDSE
ncbi:unnamed protein product [Acanthoscelides obtectus]|nr:unnamed protein product [Acanthoscelides obtectus]CAK1676020.1 Fanconi anemia group M protein homolog [Acanthoscelides obtectus]